MTIPLNQVHSKRIEIETENSNDTFRNPARGAAGNGEHGIHERRSSGSVVRHHRFHAETQFNREPLMYHTLSTQRNTSILHQRLIWKLKLKSKKR